MSNKFSTVEDNKRLLKSMTNAFIENNKINSSFTTEEAFKKQMKSLSEEIALKHKTVAGLQTILDDYIDNDLATAYTAAYIAARDGEDDEDTTDENDSDNKFTTETDKNSSTSNNKNNSSSSSSKKYNTMFYGTQRPSGKKQPKHAVASNFAKTYTTFSGQDMVCIFEIPLWGTSNLNQIIGSVQTISYSIHQEKFPIRCLGDMNAKGYVFGPRMIAGSIVFTVFNKHWAQDLMEKYLKAFKTQAHYLVDELPPFNITISFANEYGQKARLSLYGVTFTNEGQVMSANDAYVENTYQFYALDIDYLTDVVTKGSRSNKKDNSTSNLPTIKDDVIGSSGSSNQTNTNDNANSNTSSSTTSKENTEQDNSGDVNTSLAPQEQMIKNAIALGKLSDDKANELMQKLSSARSAINYKIKDSSLSDSEKKAKYTALNEEYRQLKNLILDNMEQASSAG